MAGALRGYRSRLLAILVTALAVVGSCGPAPTSKAAFDVWLAEDESRIETFVRFDSVLRQAGVADVVPAFQLWRADQLRKECVTAPFFIPPEEDWPHIIPTLRFLRDHVKPAIGAVEVQSSYRDPNFNACVHGARLSAHQGFYALDLLPLDPAIRRDVLISRLCPIHAREGPGARVGFGIYKARRFHIDTRQFRGWGEDFRGATFPCRTRT
jgi:hypothetical protein